MLDCVFISAKRLKSKYDKDFNLVAFVVDGDLFKCVVNDVVFSQLQNLKSGVRVLVDYELSVWSENLQVKITAVQPFDDDTIII